MIVNVKRDHFRMRFFDTALGQKHKSLIELLIPKSHMSKVGREIHFHPLCVGEIVKFMVKNTWSPNEIKKLANANFKLPSKRAVSIRITYLTNKKKTTGVSDWQRGFNPSLSPTSDQGWYNTIFCDDAFVQFKKNYGMLQKIQGKQAPPRNHYEFLGVSQSASKREIISAYKNAMMIYHPDKPTRDKEKFERAMAARDVLKDPQKRKRYDWALSVEADSVPKKITTASDLIGLKCGDLVVNAYWLFRRNYVTDIYSWTPIENPSGSGQVLSARWSGGSLKRSWTVL